MPLDEKQARQVLIEAVDQGLISLGESGRKAIYFHLQNIASLVREDIPENLETLERGLEKIFGAGAQMIEMAIIKSLYQKLDIRYEQKKISGFARDVKEAFKMANVQH